MQTKSKYFKDSEIRGVLPDGSIYLKTGVRRKKFKEDLWNTEIVLDSQLNHELINYQKWDEFYKTILGEDDYENE